MTARPRIVAILVACALIASAVLLRVSGAGAAEPGGERAGADPNLAQLQAKTAARMRAEDVVDVPVRFSVRNVNRSKAACPADGRTYTVSGHLTAPADLPRRGGKVTLYLHGLETGESYWRVDARGYHTSEEMARLGHASVTIDRLGYGRSGRPNGLDVCVGSQADVASQVVGQLRDASYAGPAGWQPVGFSWVGVAGQGIGAQIAEVSAFSFHDADALMLFSWTDQPLPDVETARFFSALTACMRAAGPRQQTAPGAGYLFLQPGAAQFTAANLAGAGREVADVAAALRHAHPCGDMASQLEATPVALQHLCEIDVPVLLVYGSADRRIQGTRTQRELFCGTPDVEVLTREGAGHYVTMARGAKGLYSSLATWLDDHAGRRSPADRSTSGDSSGRASPGAPVGGAAAAPAVQAPPGTQGLLDIPIAFQVRNVNRTAIPCASDGRRYTIRGHLTATASALRRRGPAVTLYLHGTNTGEWIWRLPAGDGVSFVGGQAAAGHVSVTIDRLGYGASDHPDGFASCTGAHADIAHQIVQQLKAGTYQAAPGLAGLPRFGQVVLAGHSSGGLVAEIEGYTFHDVAGIIDLAWAAVGLTPDTSRRFFRAYTSCLGGAATAVDRRPGDGAPGYVAFDTSRSDFLAGGLGNHASARVAAAVGRHYSAAPCGVMASEPGAILQDLPRISALRVPVLLVFGARDVLRQNVERYPSLFTGHPDVQVLTVPEAGHFVTVDVHAAQVRTTVDRWLNTHTRG